MDNPHVDCIGHLTARKITRRPPADVDVGRVIEHGARDGNVPRDQLAARPARPRRRRTRGRRARRALRLTVSSDAHQVAALAYTELGLGQARRAWLTRDSILNTRPWDEVRRLLKP